MTRTALDRLITPRSIAIVGASSDPTKLTGRPLAYLDGYRYPHPVYPINPREQMIGDRRCYPDPTSLPEAPDVALVLVGSDRVIDAVKQLSARGTAAAIILAGGFGESGPEGVQRQRELIEAAGSMRLLGPNTIGLINLTDGIPLSASATLEGETLRAGNVALISQSGGILGSLLSRAAARGLGFSKLIATGNEADLDVAAVLDHLVDDPATRVIALYLEGLRRPLAFRHAAQRAARAGKPIVVFKVGRSDAGVRAAMSHTGALAGSDAAYDALFRQYGIIRAERFSDLLDLPLALSCGRRLAGRRLAIVTSTGGAAGLVADAAGLTGFATPAPDAATTQVLTELGVAGAILDSNPIDLTLAGAKPTVFRSVIAQVLDSPGYDAVAVVLGSSSANDPDRAIQPLLDCAGTSTKPIIAYVSPDAPLIVRKLNEAGIPAFAAPESCAAALAAMWFAQHAIATETREALAEPSRDNAEIAIDLNPGPLNEAESKALFAKFGLPVTREIVADTPEAAETAAQTFGGNVVVKILSRAVLHKTEAGGVALDVPPHAAAATCARMARMFTSATAQAPEGFLVQEQVEGGVELILGLARDPQLGPCVLLGMGGVATELFRDTAMRLVPVSRHDAETMIGELKSAPLLNGFRGRPIADTDALADAIVAFSHMIERLSDRLSEAEINPLFVLPKGRGVVAADAVVVV
ncbi:acetate--CoA ligase family protein [Bradyrhizobium prioriisuperbiae]|uniref:acetate--CoA ligase family protein n=1 Tax=Bradyrhizobium prioriisuperbiae TaxID=2854389 RepID=UPI0028EC4603|nr:acetate--CoA ligase family protein [Bradyrhizobium prioritasuperba]